MQMRFGDGLDGWIKLVEVRMREVHILTPYCSVFSTTLDCSSYTFKSPEGPLKTRL